MYSCLGLIATSNTLSRFIILPYCSFQNHNCSNVTPVWHSLLFSPPTAIISTNTMQSWPLKNAKHMEVPLLSGTILLIPSLPSSPPPLQLFSLSFSLYLAFLQVFMLAFFSQQLAEMKSLLWPWQPSQQCWSQCWRITMASLSSSEVMPMSTP